MHKLWWPLIFVFAVVGLPLGVTYHFVWGASDEHCHKHKTGTSPLFKTCVTAGILQTVALALVALT
ncbi:hypothetical protein ACO1LA_14535, partial [Staphylococcus aureus]